MTVARRLARASLVHKALKHKMRLCFLNGVLIIGNMIIVLPLREIPSLGIKRWGTRWRRRVIRFCIVFANGDKIAFGLGELQLGILGEWVGILRMLGGVYPFVQKDISFHEFRFTFYPIHCQLTLASSVASIAANNAPLAPYAQPGGFNDFDMMVYMPLFLHDQINRTLLTQPRKSVTGFSPPPKKELISVSGPSPKALYS